MYKKKKRIRLKIYRRFSKKSNFVLNKISKTSSFFKSSFIHHSFIGHELKSLNSKMNINLLGLRNNSCIFNSEKSLESLKNVSSICKELTRLKLPILFVNLIPEYNEIVKMAAFFSRQPILLDEFKGGCFTNKLTEIPSVVFVPSSKKHSFVLKEAHTLNLLILCVHDSDDDTNLSSFPIIASDNSLETHHGILKVVGQSFLKGSLLRFIDDYNLCFTTKHFKSKRKFLHKKNLYFQKKKF